MGLASRVSLATSSLGLAMVSSKVFEVVWIATCPFTSSSLRSNREIAAAEPTSVALRDSASTVTEMGSLVPSSVSASRASARSIRGCGLAVSSRTTRTSVRVAAGWSRLVTSCSKVSTSPVGPATRNPSPSGVGL